MPNIQVSIWIPIIVATLAIVGVIIGQLMNSRRDRQKWRLDEELEARRQQLARSSEWRGVVFDIYTEFIQEVDHLTSLYKILASAKPGTQEKGAELDQVSKQARRLALSLQLNGSEQISDLAIEFRHKLAWSIQKAEEECNFTEAAELLVDFRRRTVKFMRIDLNSPKSVEQQIAEQDRD